MAKKLDVLKHLKYILAAGSLVLLFLLLAFPHKCYAKAYSTDDIKIDYKNDTIIVNTTNQNGLYYSITTKGVPRNWEYVDPTDFFTYTEELNSDTEKQNSDIESQNTYIAGMIDLSTVRSTQDSTLYIKDSLEAQAVTATILKPLKLTVSYEGALDSTTEDKLYAAIYTDVFPYFNDETGYIRFKAGQVDYTNLSDIEWKNSLSGDYKKLSELNLEYYKALGATLYFRINSGEESISNEVRIKLAKQAAAPIIKIDVGKLTISLKDTMEYRIKPENGTYSLWTTPQFSDGKRSGFLPISTLSGVEGDGISIALPQMEIQVRTKMTNKKFASKISSIIIPASSQPIDGKTGITVEQVSAADATKGLLVKNNTGSDYQVAVIDQNVSDTDGNLKKALELIDLSAKAKTNGYVAFKMIKAGKSIRVPYSQYASFVDSYAVIMRIAGVKENKATAASEFSLASVIRGVGGFIPKADEESGTFLLITGQTLLKTINFTIAEGVTLYTSLNNAAFENNDTLSVTYTAAAGDIVAIQAYTIDSVTGEKSDTLSLRYQYVADGELSSYKNEWGYNVCKKLDQDNGDNSNTVAYQRIYLAYSTYNATVSLSDISITVKELTMIINSIRTDNPELLQAIGSFKYTVMSDGSLTSVYLYMRDQSVVTSLLAGCDETAAAILKKINDEYGSDATKIQKVKVIHDYLVLSKQYGSSSYDQTMAGSLVVGDSYKPVCMSYALAFEYCLEAAGVQSVIVYGDAVPTGGTSESHAWNMVNYGDNIDFSTMKTAGGAAIDASTWYEMDVTWDDPVNAGTDYVRYSYFNLTTAEMSSNHTRTYAVYPAYPVDKCTGTKYSYYECVTNSYY